MPTLSTVSGPGTAAENTLSGAVQDLQNYLGGGGNGSEHTFKTPAGDFTVKHYNPASENNGGPISLSGPVSGACTSGRAGYLGFLVRLALGHILGPLVGLLMIAKGPPKPDGHWGLPPDPVTGVYPAPPNCPQSRTGDVMNNKAIAGIGTLALAAACGSRTTSGARTFADHTTNLSPSATVPITGSVVVTSTSGTLPSSSKGVLHMNNGTVDVTHSKGSNNGQGSTKINAAKCSVVNVVTGTYEITGGTGSYKGATGSGIYKVTFDGTFAMTAGKCMITQNSSPASGLEVFYASGPLTVGS